MSFLNRFLRFEFMLVFYSVVCLWLQLLTSQTVLNEPLHCQICNCGFKILNLNLNMSLVLLIPS